MLVIPPRSQQLKLALSYQAWEVIAKGITALAVTAKTDKDRNGIRYMQREVNHILEQLRKEGHV